MKTIETVGITLFPLLTSYLVMTIFPSSTRSSSRGVYSEVPKPSWAPPPLAFPIVWTTLYLLMGYALANVVSKDCCVSTLSIAAVTVFVIQLGVNVAWSPVFFGQREYEAALWMIRLLVALVVINILLFYHIDHLSGYLLVPYLLWLLIAHQLNAYVVKNS